MRVNSVLPIAQPIQKCTFVNCGVQGTHGFPETIIMNAAHRARGISHASDREIPVEDTSSAAGNGEAPCLSSILHWHSDTLPTH
eukprot:5687554-Pleurochrysis_carterae.AAC.1